MQENVYLIKEIINLNGQTVFELDKPFNSFDCNKVEVNGKFYDFSLCSVDKWIVANIKEHGTHLKFVRVSNESKND